MTVDHAAREARGAGGAGRTRRWRRAVSAGCCKPWLAAAALFVLVTAVYAPSVRNDFIYDDRVVIINQPRRLNAGDVARVFREQHFPGLPYYRPVTRLTLLAQKAFHGDDPGPFHLANALLMGVTAVMAFFLLTGPPFVVPRFWAFLAAAIFALHPAASSTVYPISSGRETLLPAFFCLAALHAYIRKGRGRRAASVVIFAMAIFSKEQAVVLLPAFILADVLGLSADPPRRSLRAWAARLIPFLAVGGVYAAARIRLFHAQELGIIKFGEPWKPLLSFVYSIQTIFAPFPGLFYEPPFEVWFSPIRLLPAFLMVALLTAGIIGERARLGKIALFWLGWFVLLQLPTANILRQEASFDERYVFLGMFGVVAAAASLLGSPAHRPRVRWAMAVCGCLLVVLLGWISQARRTTFQDEYHFNRRWVETNPRAEVARNNYGMALADQGRYTEAEEQYRAAIHIDPAYTLAHNGLGRTLMALGREPEALAEYEAALGINGREAVTHMNLGDALANLGRLDEAAGHYRIALDLEPGNADILSNLGTIHLQMGNEEEALRSYQEALRLDPDHAAANGNIGVILLARGLTAAGVEHLYRAWRREPHNPVILDRLARALVSCDDPSLRDPGRAEHMAEEACRLTGYRDPRLLATLAMAYAGAGDFARARDTARTALDYARSSGDAPLAAELEGRIASYRAGRP